MAGEQVSPQDTPDAFRRLLWLSIHRYAAMTDTMVSTAMIGLANGRNAVPKRLA